MLTFVKSTGGHKLKPVKLINNVFSEGRRQLISDPDLPEHQAHRCAHLPSPERFISQMEENQCSIHRHRGAGEWSRLRRSPAAKLENTTVNNSFMVSSGSAGDS